MVRPTQHTFGAGARSGPATLILNGQPVGSVQPTGSDTSWGFGKFSPNEAFSSYAIIYGSWALLMHAEDEAGRLSRDALDELSKAEALLDSIKAQLLFNNDQETVDVAQLTIDGSLLEWKEY